MIQRYCEYNYPVATGSTGNNLDSTSEERELETEIVEQLPIIDPLDVREFVNIDDQIGVGESATIDDIVEVMNEQDGCESEEEDREMEVKTNDAIIGLDNVVKYIQQNNLGVSASLMKDLHSL